MNTRRNLVYFVVAVAALLFLINRKVQVSVSEADASSSFLIPNKTSSRHPQIPSLSKSNSPAQAIQNPAPKKTLNKRTMTADELASMCKLKNLRSMVPLSGDVQIFTARMTPFYGNENSNVAWIKSSECPNGTYSILHFSDEGEISKEIDCRKTDFTELSALSGEQGNIDEVLSNDTDFNMAITGNGYFVLQCLDSRFLLTRDGHFVRDGGGLLKNGDGCVLVDTKGFPIDSDGMADNGCNSSGKCVATVDPAFDEIEGLEYKNSYSFTANSVVPPDTSVTKAGPKILRPTFFLNSLESIRNSERGPTSVSWSNHPHVNLDSLDCP